MSIIIRILIIAALSLPCRYLIESSIEQYENDNVVASIMLSIITVGFAICSMVLITDLVGRFQDIALERKQDRAQRKQDAREAWLLCPDCKQARAKRAEDYARDSAHTHQKTEKSRS